MLPIGPIAKLVIVAVLLAGGVILWNGYIGGIEREHDAIGYARATTEFKAVADAQAERNRELQRAAEKRYTVQAEVREKFIVETIVEVRHAAERLAACPVPDRARRLLNDAAACAREDRPAACGAGEPVRPAS